MGIIYPNSMFSKPRGLCYPGGDWVASLVSGFSPIALYAADRGLYKAVAAQFTAASSEYLSRADADAASLAFGDVDFWGAAWIYADTLPTTGVCSKGHGPGWLVYYTGGNMIFQANAALAARAFSTTGAWAFLFWYHDAINDQIAISVNGGAFGTAAVSGGPGAAVAPFYVGTYSGATFPMDGRIDSLMVGASPVGGIAALTTTIRDRLYASGAGLNYADLTAAEKTAWGLVSAWDLDELSGTRNDSHGTNHLTDNNTVTSAAGKPNKLATAASDPIGLWLDQSGNARHLSAAALANQPTLALAYQNGKPAVLFDGVDDYMLASAFQSFPSKRGVLIVVEKTTLAAGTSQLCGTYSAAAIDWLAYVTKSGTKYNWFDGVSDLLSATFDGAATELEVWHRDGDTSISHRRNAALADALTCANNQPSSDVLAVGASTTAGTPYKGGIMTIALFGDKTLAEVQAIESILNSAWAVY